MENQNPQTTEAVLQEILENSRKAKNYMKWQLIITVALIVIPIIVMVVVVPYILSSVTSLYTG